ncbi:MAG: TadE family protein [Terriglobia bacterium]
MTFTCVRLRTLFNIRRLFLRTAGERGAEIVEFAFVAPLLITLMLGIFWVGRAYNTYQTITHAAREGARYAAAPTCATCVGATLQPLCGLGEATSMGQNTFPAQSGGSSSSVQAVVACALAADSLDPNLAVIVAQSIALNSDQPPNQEQGVSVSVSYPVSFPIPFVKISPITLTTQVRMRQEY